MSKRRINFITGNSNKLKEFTQIIGEVPGYEFVHKNIDLPEYQGDAETIARQKCLTALQIVNEPVLVEDSSLCFNALNGLPGPYIKWFIEKMEPKNICKLLDGFEDKSAYALCIYAYGQPGEGVQLFTGRADGRIVEPRGDARFGWTHIFEPDNYNQTYSEMKKSIKNQISHRFKAVSELKKYLLENDVGF